jgi:hypothetical protein
VKNLVDQLGVEEQNVTFNCEISKAKWKRTDLDVHVKWFKGGRELKETSHYNIVRDGVNHSLTIKDLTIDDVSEYSAEVGEERTAAKIEFKDGDVSFKTELKDIEVTEKETAQFDCEVSKTHQTTTGKELPISWYKKNDSNEEVPLTNNDHYDMKRLHHKLNLKIDTCSTEDAGTYIVTIGGKRSEARLKVKEIPVVFKRPLEDQRAKETQSCTFDCTVNRTDKPVKWFINDNLITPEDLVSGKYSIGQDKNRLHLTINNLDLDKDNNCEVTCQCGDKAKTSAKLKVDEDDIKFVERLVDIGIKELDTVQFVCRLNKTSYISRPNEELRVKWLIKNKEITDSDLKAENSRYTIEQVDTVLKLSIKDVQGDDSGEVACQVNNTLTTTAMLAVEEEPVYFVKKLSDLVCEEMPGKVCFRCELNKPFVNVKWYRKGEEIYLDDPKFDFGREGPNHFLHVKDIYGKDEGEYTIVVQGKFEKKCMATLTVKAPPKLGHLDLKYREVITLKRGQPLLIEIPFSAHPEAKATWSHDGEKLVDSIRIKTEIYKNKQVSLTVNKTRRPDSGNYILVLENECGREEATIKVNVRDRPEAPRDLTVTDISAHDMRLNWKEPLDDGSSPITGYVIEMRDMEKSMWIELDTVSGYDLTYLSKNLIKGNRYTFRVSAENKFGRSDPTEIPDIIEAKWPFDVPSAPLNCHVTDITKKECTVRFEPPASDGGSPVTGYIVERKEIYSAIWTPVTREPILNLYYNSKDLIEGLEYEYRVIAENLAGQGPPSEASKPFKAKELYEPPGPPIDLRIGAVTKNSIQLDWTAPANDGGSPILGYKIEKRNPKTMKWIPLEDSSRIQLCNKKITGLKENHDYEFRVVAFNLAGDGEPSEPTPLVVAKTHIEGEKPTVIEPMKDLRVMAGDQAQFHARVKATPEPIISWAANERTLSTILDDIVSTYDNSLAELTLPNVQVKDEGIYKLTLSNPLGEISLTANLTVLKKPTIKYDSRYDRTIDVIADHNLNLNCEIGGNPKPEVKWFKEKNEIIFGGDVSRALTDFGEQFATLTLSKIKRNEGGEYSISAENEVGKVEANFVVRVLDVPMPPEKLTVAEISSYSCKLEWKAPKDDGNVPITGYYIEKLDLKRGTYIRLDKTSLTEHYIEKLTKGEKYQFRVIAENKIGLSEPCEMDEPVEAKGKYDLPGPPGIPEISNISKHGCELDWEKPLKDGGTTILGYFVERKSGSTWIRINDKPIKGLSTQIDDLSTGSEYIFRVSAVNSEGEGPFSKNSEFVVAKNPYSKPDAPIDVDVQNVTKSSCLLTWSPPLNNGGQPIVRYHVEMRTKGEYKFFRFTDDFISECEYEVNDLIENQDYEFRIVAENKQGESPPSESTAAFTARDYVPPVLPEIIEMPDSGNLIGTKGRIEARIVGTPTPNIKWKKGARPIKNYTSKYVESFAEGIAVLYINSLEEDDAGPYTIEIDNSVGSDNKTCKFSVYMPPQINYDSKYKKKSVVSVGSNFRIACEVIGCPGPKVFWTKDGDRIKDGDKVIVDNPVEIQHYLTIKQCDRNDSGVFVIKASNEHGKAEATFELEIVDVPDKPRGPLDISVERESARSISIEWKSPKWDGNSELISYTIEYAKVFDPSVTKSKFIDSFNQVKRVYIKFFFLCSKV